MAGDPASDLRGLLALLALLLWPGIVVVRSPWAAVPFLSASFWLLSWWWIPSGRERSSFLGAALLLFVLLSLLRLLRPLPSRLPSPRALCVAFLALACLWPLRWLPVAPGLSLASAEARLVTWRDGMPATYEPLMSIGSFGAHAPGLPLFAGDIALLSGMAPHRAVLIVALASSGLLVVAIATLLERASRPRLGVAIAAAVTFSTLVGAKTGFTLAGPAALAAALGLLALGLLVRGSGRSPAVAAGALLGAAFTVQALVASCIAAAACCVGARPRRVLALVIGIVVAVPRLWLTLQAASRAEAPKMLASEVGQLVYRREAIPDADGLLAMAWVRDHSGPLDRVCVAAGGVGRFVPGVAGRAILPPEVPAVYQEDARMAGTTCRFTIVFGPFDTATPPADPRSPPFAPAAGPVAFAAGSVRVLVAASADDSMTSFDTREGNPRHPPP